MGSLGRPGDLLVKVKIDATPEEIQEKGPQLIKAIAARLGVNLAALVDDELKKAEDVLTSHYGPIQGLVKGATAVYKEEMKTMLAEINEVLDKTAGD